MTRGGRWDHRGLKLLQRDTWKTQYFTKTSHIISMCTMKHYDKSYRLSNVYSNSLSFRATQDGGVMFTRREDKDTAAATNASQLKSHGDTYTLTTRWMLSTFQSDSKHWSHLSENDTINPEFESNKCVHIFCQPPGHYNVNVQFSGVMLKVCVV